MRYLPLALGEDRDQAVVSVTEAKVLDIEPEIVETDGEAGEDSEEGTSAGESEESSDDQEDTT